jgi:hypothetical protein
MPLLCRLGCLMLIMCGCDPSERLMQMQMREKAKERQFADKRS